MFQDLPVSGIKKFTSVAYFPPLAADGTLVEALDTHSVYVFDANLLMWLPIASPMAGTAITSLIGDVTATGPGIATATLANTTVISGSYGSATQVPTFTVDSKGRLTLATNVPISISSTAITDFNEATQDSIGTILTDTTTIDFTYNDIGNTISASVLPGGIDHNLLFNFDSNKHIDHSLVSLIAGIGISVTGLGDLTASRTINLANTSIVAGSYGSASKVGSFTVDAQGRLTAASDIDISGFTTDSFSIIQTDFGTYPTADSASDTLTLTSLDNSVIITGNSSTDTIDFSVDASSVDKKVRISASDTTSGYLNSKLTITNGTNSTNPLEKSVTFPSANEELNVRFDQTKLDISQIPNVPSGDISATNVQAAFNELDVEKTSHLQAILYAMIYG